MASGHYLRTILLQEVRGAGLDQVTATVYDMEDLREKIQTRNHSLLPKVLAQQKCPRDGKLGTAYVDAIEGEDYGRAANVMLSCYWSYRIKDVVRTLLEDKYEAHQCDPKRKYGWIESLCNNLHRVDIHVPFEQFRDISGAIVTSIRTIGPCL